MLYSNRRPYSYTFENEIEVPQYTAGTPTPPTIFLKRYLVPCARDSQSNEETKWPVYTRYECYLIRKIDFRNSSCQL
jgi:hypothetical protein